MNRQTDIQMNIYIGGHILVDRHGYMEWDIEVEQEYISLWGLSRQFLLDTYTYAWHNVITTITYLMNSRYKNDFNNVS